MLHQTSHWIEIASLAVSALLLCRVLLLRLYRVYLFITLACILDLLFGGVFFWLPEGSQAGDRVFLCSRFVYALVYPMAAWDVFEEIKAQAGKLRKLAISRLIFSLFFAAIFGLIMAAFVDTGEANSGSVVTSALGLILWAGSTTASLAFLYTINRVLRTQPTALPSNTNVWIYYFGLSFLADVVFCFVLLGTQGASETLKDVLAIVFSAFDIVLTSWCILRLRPAVSDLPSAPENARL